MKSLDHYWYDINPVAILLWPLSLLFRLLVSVRRWLYRLHVFKSYSAAKPVIVIGNISVGGTGKTPLIIALVKLLSDMDIKVGIISRGYGGSGPFPLALSAQTQATEAGDEPVQIYQRTGCPMVVGPDRVAAADLLSRNYDIDIILSDDGLQHYRMQRDLEIVVIDSEKGFGNGFSLPAGPLREPLSRINDQVISIYNGGNGEFNFSILPQAAINLSTGEKRELTAFAGEAVEAVAGIGNPQRFFKMLKSSGITVNEHAFPDHYVFSRDDLKFNNARAVLMTEKDSVKCTGFALENTWYVPIDIELSQPFITQFKQHVEQLTRG